MSVIGIMPMAGSAERMGLPFPKPLLPTIGADGQLTFLYQHALKTANTVCDRVRAILRPDRDQTCLHDHILGVAGVQPVWKPEKGEMPSSLAAGAIGLQDDDICVVVLPDAIAHGRAPISDLVAGLRSQPEIDAVLGLYVGDAHQIDAVKRYRSPNRIIVTPHATSGPGKLVLGWGVIVARPRALAGLTDYEPIAHQLSRLRLDTMLMWGCYHDLGTPERYLSNFDIAFRHGGP